MKLQFSEAEINAGVRHAVGIMGFDLTGKELTVDYSMGRGKNGLSAEVTITDPTIVEVKPAAVVIPGFTDTAEVAATATDVAVEAVTETVAAPVGEEAAALFGDDD
jgi:hypothetical protein